jgi:hypothetical protein
VPPGKIFRGLFDAGSLGVFERIARTGLRKTIVDDNKWLLNGKIDS